MLKFHQEETCDAIIDHLEKREAKTRHDVHVRDVGNHTSPDARVEMTFRLGDQLYAIEHTGIEPFDGFMEHQNRAPELFKPLDTEITAALGALLAPGVVIEMHIPIDAFKGRKLSEVRALHGAMATWAAAMAPTLSRGENSRGSPFTAQPPGVPFSASLVRFDGFGRLPGPNQASRQRLRTTAGTQDQARMREEVSQIGHLEAVGRRPNRAGARRQRHSIDEPRKRR